MVCCWPALPFCPRLLSIVICAPELLVPKLMVISSGGAEEEPLLWPRLITISGVVEVVPVVAPVVVDPLKDEALVLEAPPRLMVMSSRGDEEPLLCPKLIT